MRRFFTLVSLVVGLLVVGATAASAHDALESTTPVDGATLDRLPQQVTLTFAEQPLALGMQVLVNGPSGNVAQGQPTINGPVVTQRLSPEAPGGRYAVTYRITSSDGHPISGTFGFHATVGLDGSAATAAATQQAPVAAQAQDAPGQVTDKGPNFVPVMLTIAGAVIIIAMFAGIWLVSRRRAAAADLDTPGTAGPGHSANPTGPANRG